MKLDAIDYCLLGALQRDSSLTVSELAATCRLSRTPVHERVKKLEKAGVIAGYRAHLQPAAVGFDIHAFCNISLKEHAKRFLEQFELSICEHSEVVACHHIAGMFDYLIEIRVPDMESYQHFISNKLASIENIGNVQSSFVMKELLANRGMGLSLIEDRSKKEKTA